MTGLEVEVWDATGDERARVEAPDDVPVERLMLVLLTQPEATAGVRHARARTEGPP